jgi:hypothetical protein
LHVAGGPGALFLHSQPGQQRPAPALIRGRIDGRRNPLRRDAPRLHQRAGRYQARERILHAGQAGARQHGAMLLRQQTRIQPLPLALQIGGVGLLGRRRIPCQRRIARTIVVERRHPRSAAYQLGLGHAVEAAGAGRLAARAREFHVGRGGVAVQPGVRVAVQRAAGVDLPVGHLGLVAGAAGQRQHRQQEYR